MTIELTAERLRALLVYDAETGRFYSSRGRKGITPGSVVGQIGTHGYRYIRLDYRRHAAHRLAWLYVFGEWPRDDIDHINGDRDDNRIANLRDVSRSVNMQNQRKARGNNKTSGLLGVNLHSANNWRARIQIEGGKQIHLGLFKSAEEAHAAYLAAKRAIHTGCAI